MKKLAEEERSYGKRFNSIPVSRWKVEEEKLRILKEEILRRMEKAEEMKADCVSHQFV